MTVILSQQFFLGAFESVGLLTAVRARALALHSRQGREPLRGNITATLFFIGEGCVIGVCANSSTAIYVQVVWPASPRNLFYKKSGASTVSGILAVGAEALPVTPSGGALFAS